MDRTRATAGGGRDGDSAPRQTLTAVDLGSNSFYLLQARLQDGRLESLARRRESVRLVAGIDAAGRLDTRHRARALECLERFGAFTRTLPAHTVRVVATSAVRRLKDRRAFLDLAERALGQSVEVIDGLEEGRLIWVGAADLLPPTSAGRLVIDIGGGSTECIVGRGRESLHVASIDIGCIVTCTQFFADGRVDAGRWRSAGSALQAAIAPHAGALRDHGWAETWGTSGSARAIGAIVRGLGLAEEGISAAAIVDLRQRLLEAGRVDRLDWPGLDAQGSEVVAGTVAVLDALFEALGLQHMALCDSAMREGIIRDLAAGRNAGAGQPAT